MYTRPAILYQQESHFLLNLSYTAFKDTETYRTAPLKVNDQCNLYALLNNAVKKDLVVTKLYFKLYDAYRVAEVYLRLRKLSDYSQGVTYSRKVEVCYGELCWLVPVQFELRLDVQNGTLISKGQIFPESPEGFTLVGFDIQHIG